MRFSNCYYFHLHHGANLVHVWCCFCYFPPSVPPHGAGSVSVATASSAQSVSEGFAPVAPLEEDRLLAIKIQICNAIAGQPAVIYRLADLLRCLGLISVSIQEAAKFSDGKSPYEKADAMIGPVVEHIRSDPKNFAPALMRALNSIGLGCITTETSLIAAGEPC